MGNGSSRRIAGGFGGLDFGGFPGFGGFDAGLDERDLALSTNSRAVGTGGSVVNGCSVTIAGADFPPPRSMTRLVCGLDGCGGGCGFDAGSPGWPCGFEEDRFFASGSTLRLVCGFVGCGGG